MYNKEENNTIDYQRFSSLKILFYSFVIAMVLCASCYYYLFDHVLTLPPAVMLYVETGDILVSLLAVYVLLKWFHIPFLRKSLGNEASDALGKLQTMCILRYAIWEGLCLVNILLWRFFGVDNALYILIILAASVVMMLPTNDNLQRSYDLISK